MAPIRQLSSSRLVALVAGLAVAVVAGGAVAIAATGGGPKPRPKKLDVAIHDALSAPKVAGITARIRFTNHVIDSAGIQGGGPIMSGASGRAWASADGRVRLELQSDDGGDAQVVLNDRQVSVYEPRSNTVYRATLPSHPGERSHSEHAGPPTLGQIGRALAKAAERAHLSGAQPDNVAGKPAYSVKVTPRDRGGLVGGARLTWDAAKGLPLGVAVYAAHSADPVLELKATHVAYGAVPASTFSFAPPNRAKVVDLTGRVRRTSARSKDKKERRPATGLAAVRHTAGFRLSAPGRLAGRPRTQVRSLGSGAHPAALVAYGEGLGGLVVIESPANAGKEKPSKPKEGQPSLPKVSINGASGQELPTALGTVVRFERGGVSYVVVGSVTPAVAEAAARGL